MKSQPEFALLNEFIEKFWRGFGCGDGTIKASGLIG
jgi:hypothetical protein